MSSRAPNRQSLATDAVLLAPATKAQARAWAGAGWSLGRIAAHLGVSAPTLRSRAARMGLPVAAPGPKRRVRG